MHKEIIKQPWCGILIRGSPGVEFFVDFFKRIILEHEKKQTVLGRRPLRRCNRAKNAFITIPIHFTRRSISNRGSKGNHGEYTHGELAYFLDVSMPTLTKWRQKGLIPYNRDRHGKIRYKKKDVWVFVEKYNNSRQ